MGSLRVHVVASAVCLLGGATIIVFWQYPRLLVYLLLAAVALLAYSALYLVLASRLDPVERPPVADTMMDLTPTEPVVAVAPARRRGTRRKKAAVPAEEEP